MNGWMEAEGTSYSRVDELQRWPLWPIASSPPNEPKTFSRKQVSTYNELLPSHSYLYLTQAIQVAAWKLFGFLIRTYSIRHIRKYARISSTLHSTWEQVMKWSYFRHIHLLVPLILYRIGDEIIIPNTQYIHHYTTTTSLTPKHNQQTWQRTLNGRPIARYFCYQCLYLFLLPTFTNK